MQSSKILLYYTKYIYILSSLITITNLMGRDVYFIFILFYYFYFYFYHSFACNYQELSLTVYCILNTKY